MNKILLIIFCFLISTPLLAEQEIIKNDFHHGVTINVAKQGNFYEFALPNSVYRGVQNSDLSDIRVFDAEGKILPALMNPNRDDLYVVEKTYPIYPVKLSKTTDINDLHLRITKNEDGTFVQLDSQREQDDAKTGYLIDASELSNQNNVKIIIDWATTSTKNWLLPIKILGSDNLSDWDEIADTTLANLTQNNSEIKKNSVYINNNHYPYWMIIPSKNIQNTNITDVKVAYTIKKDSLLYWLSSTLEVNGQNDFFNTQGFFPMQEIDFDPGDHDVSFQVTVFSRDNETVPWSVVAKDSIFSVVHEAKTRKKLKIKFSPNTDRYWKFEITPSIVFPVQIKIGWKPTAMVFFSNNPGPFTLAFGSAMIMPIDDSGAALFQSLAQANQLAGIEGSVTLDETPSIINTQKNTVPKYSILFTKSFILWFIIGISVLILAIMTLSLARKLK
jgi:hypothetical protein